MGSSLRFYFPKAALILLLLSLSLWGVSAAAYLGELSSEFVRSMGMRFGSEAVVRLDHWRRVEKKAFSLTDPLLLLQRVNALANEIPYLEDLRHWGSDEYWSTPVEFVASGGGDCEDYAIAKYFSLRAAGVPPERLRITYVRALFEGRLVNHMVLSYYEKPSSDPLILDNINPTILPASKRPDLIPVFSFNDEVLSRTARDGSMARRWRELLSRVQEELRL